LQEYVLINQYEMAIEQYIKTEEDSWLFRAYESDAKKIGFASLDLEMTMTDIYENVDFQTKNLEW
jgi:Uma2 family endonuclease